MPARVHPLGALPRERALAAPLPRPAAQQTEDDLRPVREAFVSPWTIADVAVAANVSPAFVRKCIRAGVLEARHVGRLIRIPAPAARRFVEDLGGVAVDGAHGTHGAHHAHGLTFTVDQRRERA